MKNEPKELKSTPFDFEAILTDIVSDEILEEVPMTKMDDNHLLIREEPYTIAINYQEGFDFDEFKRLYQDYFEKYDFIVGDWAYEKLRLRGFYQLNYRKSAKDRLIDFLDDYLKEYCSFGCRYFVLGKDKVLETFPHMLEKYQENLVRSERRDKWKVATREKSASSQKKKKSRTKSKNNETTRSRAEKKANEKQKFVQKIKQKQDRQRQEHDQGREKSHASGRDMGKEAKRAHFKEKKAFVIKKKGQTLE